jgi:hypothetical protein
VWEVECTDQFGTWWAQLNEGDQNHVDAAVEVLERIGPALGRPLVDTIATSRHQTMKELRPMEPPESSSHSIPAEPRSC